MEEQKIKIYSYRKVWKVEKKVYALQNLRFPFPINTNEALEMIAVGLFIFILGYIITPINRIPLLLRLVAAPYIITQYLMKKKLDGKNPLKYLLGCLVYVFTVRGRYLQRMKSYADKREKVKLSWNCSMGISRPGTE